MKPLLYSICLSLILLVNNTTAQLDSIQLPEASVISSTKEIKPVESINRQTISLHGEELVQQGYSSVDEALRFTAGIEIQQRGPVGVQSDISARGSTFNQVLVLLDGVRLNDPLTGHFSGYFPIPLSEVERIEVIKGASSGIYGTEAVGAVIQVISKGYHSKQDSAIHGSISLMAGSFETIMADGYLQFDRKKWSIGLGAAQRKSDGFTAENDSIPYDFDLQTYSANLQFHPNSDWKAGIRASIDKRDFNARYFYTRSTFDLSREIVDRWSTQAYLKRAFSDALRAELHAGFMSTDDDFLFNPLFTGNFHTTQQLDMHSNLLWEVDPNRSYTFGAQWLYRSVESNDRGNHEIDQFGIYASQQWQIDDWRWSLSGRLENHQAFGWELVPQTSLSKEFNGFLISAFFGRAIRAADITELYVSNNLDYVSPGRNLGNPLLGAESSWNSELNFSGRIDQKLNWDLCLFHRYSNDLIDFVLTPSTEFTTSAQIEEGESYFYAQNVEELQTIGADIQLHGAVSTSPKNKIIYNAGMLYVSHLDSVASKYVAGSEGIQFNFRVGIEHGRIGLFVSNLYKERDAESATSINRSLGSSYNVSDVNLSFKVVEWMRLELNCRNVFDRQYSDVLGAALPGRWWTTGLKANF